MLINNIKFNSKFYEIIGVVSLAISGNFIYNVVVRQTGLFNYYIFGIIKISDLWYNLLYGGFFIFVGIYYLYFSAKMSHNETDYSKTDKTVDYNSWLEKRIRNLRIIKDVSIYIIIFLLVAAIFPFKTKIISLNTVNYFNKEDEVKFIEIYAKKNHYYQEQFNLLKYLINKDSLKTDTLNVIDVSSGSGNFVEMIKDSFPNIFILGSDGDINAIKYSKEKLKNKNYEYLIINRPVLWQKLSRNKIIEIRKYDFVFLLGNSIPNLNDSKDLPYVFIEINKILKKNGILLLDYNNYIDYKNKHMLISNIEDGIKCKETFEDKDNFVNQCIYIFNEYKNKKIGEFSVKLNKDCLNKQNLINNLKIAGFNVLSDDEFSKHYNCSDLTLIVAQKK